MAGAASLCLADGPSLSGLEAARLAIDQGKLGSRACLGLAEDSRFQPMTQCEGGGGNGRAGARLDAIRLEKQSRALQAGNLTKNFQTAVR